MFLKYRNAQFPQFIVITLCALSGTHTAHAASATWNGASSSSWSASPNWSASPGPGTGNAATFDNSTAGAAQTIITGSITIASILFNTGSAAAYTLGGASTGMGQITLNDGGSIAVSSSITRSQTVNANLVLGTDARTASYSLSNNSTSAGQLLTFAGTIDSGKKHRESSPKILILGGIGDGRISGVISGNGSGSGNSETAQVAVTKNGHGTWTFSGVNTYTGLTDIQAGTLAYGVSNALASGASGSIANSAEVSLDGGNLNVAAMANASLGSGQSLTGDGSVTGDLTIQGTLAIGSLLGTIAFEHNLALQSGSIANFDFSSGGFGIGTYDLAKGGLSKMVSFGGALNLHFKPGEVFSNDTNVKIFDFGHYEGAFSAVNVSGLSGGHSAIVDSGTGIVTVVPEPKAALLAGLGVLPLFTRRRWLAANARV